MQFSAPLIIDRSVKYLRTFVHGIQADSHKFYFCVHIFSFIVANCNILRGKRVNITPCMRDWFYLFV